jgi:hypothetical protein
VRETYKEFIEMADLLKEATDGKINMYITGTIKKTALKLFNDLTPFIQPEAIKQDEALWIAKAMKGGMIWADEYEGEAYQYDICSMYMAIMKEQHFSVPIRRGTFKKLTKEEFNNKEYFEYGIYRVMIFNTPPGVEQGFSRCSTNPKLFRINTNHYYTHYDLAKAKEEGYKMELIEDNQPNALIYGATQRVNGNIIFKEFVELIFSLKKKGIAQAKLIGNSLWGAMCQKNEISVITETDMIIKIKEDRTLTKIETIDENSLRAKFVKNAFYYESNFARIGPFITAFARRMIANIIKPHLQYVKRIHTDGFISTKKLEFNKKGRSMSCVKEGNNIGNIKYEGYCKFVKIVNCNTILGVDGKKAVFQV